MKRSLVVARASVVVPFGGGGLALLQEQLLAVDRSALDAASTNVECEVVVAVNAVDAVTEVRAVVEDLDLQTPVTVIDASERRGPSFARNRGAAQSRGDVLLFCDADDLVSPGWIPAMVAALTNHDIARGALDLQTLNRGASARSSKPVRGSKPNGGWLPSCPGSNMGVRREAFLQAEGFDESLNVAEDVDFSWRVQYQGGSFGMASDAVVAYRWRHQLREHFAQVFRWGVGDAILARKHRSHGLRPQVLRGLKRTLRAVVYIAATPLLYDRRWHAVGAFAMASGRIAGSLRYRTWCL